MRSLHKEIHLKHRIEQDAAPSARSQRLGSALAPGVADGAEPDPKVGKPQAEAGENHQEHEPIDDVHMQWHRGQSQLEAAGELFFGGSGRFKTLMIME
jgi:hypothetical protein